MHDGNFPGVGIGIGQRNPLITEPRRISTDDFKFESFRVGPALKPQIEEILIAAHRIKGVAEVTTKPEHQTTMTKEVEALISEIKKLLTKV